MTRTRAKRAASVLASPRLAVTLLVVLGAISFLATLVPQADKPAQVALWAAKHPLAESVVRFTGFHNAHSSLLFVACVLLLGVSTGVCAWRRTRASLSRAAAAEKLGDEEARSLTTTPTFTTAVRCDSEEALAHAEHAIRSSGFAVRRGSSFVVGGLPKWRFFASPAFHWTLVVLFVVIAAGRLTRAEGLMGIPVGGAVQNVPGSYGLVSAGPLYAWSKTPVTIAVDSLRPDYTVGGIDRGTVPEVTISSGGRLTARQLVYPNNALHSGSLVVHSSAYGLTASFALESTGGVQLGSANAFIDFDATSTTGTSPGSVTIGGAPGQPPIVAKITVPLDRASTGFVDATPAHPVATVDFVDSVTQQRVGGGTVSENGTVALPDGTLLRLVGVKEYARLAVVDDWSVPLLYALFGIATLLVSAAILLRQALVVAVVEEAEGGGSRLLVRVREWRGSGLADVLCRRLESACGTDEEAVE